MSCGGESPADAAKIGPIQGIVGRKGEVGDAVKLGCILSGLVKLTLEIDLGNGDITQGHTNILMTEQVHERWKRDAQADHFGSEGVTTMPHAA